MTTSGVTTGTVNGSPVGIGDGVDDQGLASGPETLPATGDLSVAVTVADGSQSSTGNITRVSRNNRGRFGLVAFGSSSPQGLRFILSDKRGNGINVETSTGHIDGSPQLLLVTKSGDDAADIDLFVDDMETAKSQTVNVNGGFTTADYLPSIDMGFFCRNTGFTGTTGFLDFKAGRFQFFDAALTEQERKSVKNRAKIL
jgi:hypothetical protein